MTESNRNNGQKDFDVKSIRVLSDNDTAPKKATVRRVGLEDSHKMEISLTLNSQRFPNADKPKMTAPQKAKRVPREISPVMVAERKPKTAKKPKKKGKELTASPEFMVINVGVVLIVVLAIMLCLYCFERSSGVSEYEKRELAKFPKFSLSSYFDGSYTSDISYYFTDTVPNRDNLKSLCNKFKGLFGISANGGSAIVNNGGSDIKHEEFEGKVTTSSHTIYIPGVTSENDSQTTPDGSGTTSSTTTTTTTSETSKDTSTKKPNGGGETLSNGILIINKGTSDVMAMELYGGGFDAGKKYANILNKYRDDLVTRLDGKVNVYSMCIPMAVAYYLPEDFKNQSASIPDNILNINSYLNGVISIDAYNAIKGHTDEYIYSRTDHHWQPIGAYYAAKEFAKTAMVDFPDLSQYEKKKKEGFVGTLYGFSNESELLKYPDDFIYYVPQNNYTTYNYNSDLSGKVNGYLLHEYASGTNTYSMFLGDDKHVVQLDTDAKNGRTLVVFKDSFGNALIPFLTSSFEHIYVVDYRYCNFNAVDFCVDVGATDVLFATSMFTCTSTQKVPIFEENRTK